MDHSQFAKSWIIEKFAVDHAGGGYLFQQVRKEVRFDEVTTRLYIAEVSLALEDLLRCDPMRLYISDENLLLDGLGHVTFRDFNVSQVRVSRNVTDERHLKYMAPEVVRRSRCTWSANLWSLGVLMLRCVVALAPSSGSLLKKLPRTFVLAVILNTSRRESETLQESDEAISTESYRGNKWKWGSSNRILFLRKLVGEDFATVMSCHHSSRFCILE